jgi:hypothetical protein
MNASSVHRSGQGDQAGHSGREHSRGPSYIRCASAIVEEMGQQWLPRLYREKVLTQRTRSFHLTIPSRNPGAEVQRTLLGIEVKIGRRRVLCPDLATARYLAVFAIAGCPDIAIPYDITHVAGLADELESSWLRMFDLISSASNGRAVGFRYRLRAALIQQAQAEIKEAGAGTAI